MLCNFNKVKYLGKVSFLNVCRYIRSTEDLQNQLCIIFCVSFCEANVVLEDTKYSEYSYSTNVPETCPFISSSHLMVDCPKHVAQDQWGLNSR